MQKNTASEACNPPRSEASVEHRLEAAEVRSKWVSARVTVDEYRGIVEAADRAGLSVSEYSRKVHLESLGQSPFERLVLLNQIVEGAMTRAYIVAAQDGKDLEDEGVMDGLERGVLELAEALLERRLMLLKRVQGRVEAA